MNASIQRLRAEVRSDWRAFDARVAELATLGLADPNASPAVLAQAAVALHHAYGAVEAALVRVARSLEGSVPSGPDWHQDLLTSMGLEIEAVRPSVLSAESVSLLRSLLGFRHFFRHAYAVSLDKGRLDDLRRKAIALRPILEQDLDRLDALLRDLAQAD